MKNVFVMVLVASLSACSLLDRMPDRFNAVEYGYLAELSVVTKWKDGPECHVDDMLYLSRTLVEYSRRFNKLNQDIYSNINQRFEDIYAKENPSDAYCRIKKREISKIIDETLDVYGSRLP